MQTTMTLTDEQQAIVDAFNTGGSLVIEAGAGTGKTSTLRAIADSTDRNGIYIAYNKAAADDAKASFPSNVDCRTAHSLAYGVVGKKFRPRMNSQRRVPARAAAAFLGIHRSFQISDDHELANWKLARLALDTVDRFCYSADTQITERHVPYVEGVENMDDLKAFIVPFARKAWADLSNPAITGQLFFKHDHYLKLYALTNPVLKADFIMLDEAQDANPVIAQIVGAQPCQKIMVGDRCQAIYGWRGAVDAMTSFDADHRLMLSQSFRFGQAVADEANKFLNLLDSPLRLKGFDKLNTTVEPLAQVDAILCRTNANAIAEAMAAQAEGKKVAIVGGTKDIENFAWGVYNLQNGKECSHPDLIAFTSWDEVIDYAENDSDGADLKVWVKLIQTYGVYKIIDVAKASTDEKAADLIISTAHRSKGREWNRVRIGSDFKAPEEGTVSNPELMLMYVAVTRAQQALDHTALAWIDSYIASAV